MRLANSIRMALCLAATASLLTLGGCDGGADTTKPIVVDKADAEKQGKATEDFYKNAANKPKAGAKGTGPSGAGGSSKQP